MSELSVEDKRYLLQLARQSIAASFEGNTDTKPPQEAFQRISMRGGVFVSLHKREALRGCIGNLEMNEPVVKSVWNVARQSAFKDPRFEPLEKRELEFCDLEISILTPPEPWNRSDPIVIGKHGLIVSRGSLRGLLLPQVAAKYDWTPEQFLEHTCQKAWLPEDAWKESDVEIETFEAIVFSETDVE